MREPSRSSASGGTDLLDLTGATVVHPAGLTGPEAKAITLLIEEVEKRARVRFPAATTWPSPQTPVIAIGPTSHLQTFAGPHADSLGRECDASAAEGYCIRVLSGGPAPIVSMVGNDSRGVLFGVGHLLRSLRMQVGRISLPAGLHITTAPCYPMRGHQLGYRDKTNSYCGWDLPQWEQYIRDLAVFGANTIELIPPRSDDNPDSVHFPRPALEMMAGMSALADDYGLDVSIWYPAMDENYTDAASVALALDERREVFKALPRIDAVFVPGGDPGHAHPRDLMPFLAQQAALLHRFHPVAQTWVSPQGFTGEWMEAFLSILARDHPIWLAGVVHGPWVHMTMTQFRKLIPERYPIRAYPDITHCFSCQYPVPDWDPAFALTLGREPINPRPRDQAAIFHYSQPETIGFVTYSEGCNDDVNKCVWASLGWDPDRDVTGILREYSRYFIGEAYADTFAQGLLALERNWRGSPATNEGVHTTLHQFRDLERAASPRDLKNWRFQQALYRAYYDAYVRSRLLYESGLEEQAMDRLRHAPVLGSHAAMAEAERVLDLAVTEPVSAGWRTRIFQLAEALFQSIHMQLSVPLYRAKNEVRGANLDAIDYPLNDSPSLKALFGDIRQLQSEDERLEAIDTILRWTDPGPGGFYDNLGRPFGHPHLVAGLEYAQDPAFLASPLCKYPGRKDPLPLRRAWRGCTGSLLDASFQMRYTDLDPDAHYRVRIVYSDLHPEVKVQLVANDDIKIHPLIYKRMPRGPVEFEIPPATTAGGELRLTWSREQGLGGNGGGCEVSEVWLVRGE